MSAAALAMGVAAQPALAPAAERPDLGADVHAVGARDDGGLSGPGLGESALPGLHTVGIPDGRRPGVWAVAASSGYGFTTARAPGADGHHRLAGAVALAVTPVAGLDLSLRLAGRREAHPADAQGSDDSYTGEPALLARYGRTMSHARVGTELGVRVPGQQAPSLDFGAAVIDLKLLAAYVRGPLVLAGAAGFRLDHSANARPDLARTRPGDRLALGLSDYHAALVGIGVGYRVRPRTEAIAELSGDLLLGGPAVGESPMRVAAGVRQHVGAHWQVFALAAASPTQRGSHGPSDPLVPNEPRFGFMAGLNYAWGTRAEARTDMPADFVPAVPAAPGPPPEPTAEDPQPAPDEGASAADAAAGQLRGLIRSFNGRGLSAVVTVEPLGTATHSESDGSFTLDVPPGSYEVVIEAEGFATQRREVRVEENGVTILNADLRLARGRP